METYHFTKRQAEAAARATIINYFERYPNAWQDETQLAFDVSALLGIKPEPNYVGAALQALDDLSRVERGIHEDLVATDPVDLVERFEGDLMIAIYDVTSTFPELGRQVFVPAMEAAA